MSRNRVTVGDDSYMSSINVLYSQHSLNLNISVKGNVKWVGWLLFRCETTVCAKIKDFCNFRVNLWTTRFIRWPTFSTQVHLVKKKISEAKKQRPASSKIDERSHNVLIWPSEKAEINHEVKKNITTMSKLKTYSLVFEPKPLSKLENLIDHAVPRVHGPFNGWKHFGSSSARQMVSLMSALYISVSPKQSCLKIA